MVRLRWLTLLLPCLLSQGVAISAARAADSNFERDVLAEINFVRTHPQEYAQELVRYRQDFEGRLMRGDDETGDIMTREGVAAVDEAIRDLNAQQPLTALEGGATLGEAAFDLVDEQGRRGQTGHVSEGGMTPSKRVERRGGGPYVAETISYGSLTPAGVVRQLIVDDGVPDRGHRKVILTERFRYAGVGCGAHAVYRFMCVIDYGVTADGRPQSAQLSAGSR